MRRLVIIFTYKYPFSPPVEQFLHMELPYHIDENTDIWLVPSSRELNQDEQYSYNDKQVGCVVLNRRSKQYEICFGVLGIVTRLKSFINECRDIFRTKNIPRKAAFISLLKTYIQSQGLYQAIKRTLDMDSIKGYSEVLLYSYWLNPMASAICHYKRYLLNSGCENIRAISRAHGQGDLYPEPNIGLFRPNAKLLSTQLDAIYSISDGGCSFLKQQGIENVLASKLGVHRVEKMPIKQKNERPTVVSCSVINDNKRVGDIAKAVSAINRPLRWIHFGDGPNEQQLTFWCQENMPQNIQWEIRGWTANEAVLNFYETDTPDVFVNLSRVEGIPVSVMEAMSYAVVCIATDTGASKEIVHNGYNGFLVDVDFKSEDVTECILKCIDDKSDVLRSGAFDTAGTQYCCEDNFNSFCDNIWRDDKRMVKL